MKTTVQGMIALFALVVLLVVASSAQGLHWKATTTAMGKEMNNEFFCMPKMVKTVSDNGEVMLLRVDRKVIYTINAKEKEYSETTFHEVDSLLAKMAAKMKATSEKMKEQFKNMPEAQRKMMEQMMGGAGNEAPAMTKKTDEQKKIAGYSCTKHIIMQGEKELVTVWATQEVKDFLGMRKDFEEFSKRMMGQIPGMGAALEELMKLPGFAMETQFGTMMTQVVTSMEKRTTPASEYEVPSGLKKVKSEWQKELEKPDSNE
jgi:GLPGLI family protein